MSLLLDRAVARLSTVPLPIVVAVLVVGAVLGDVHTLLVQRMARGGPEPEQWVARLTVMQYYALIPLALLALWARRRPAQGRLGTVAAALLVTAIAGHLAITVAAVVHGGLLGRGDLPGLVMMLEVTVLGLYLGVMLEGIALLRDRAVPRAAGALVLLGLVVSFIAPFALTVAWLLLGAVLLGSSRRQAVAARDSAAAAGAV
jgi:hypothetical protein